MSSVKAAVNRGFPGEGFIAKISLDVLNTIRVVHLYGLRPRKDRRGGGARALPAAL